MEQNKDFQPVPRYLSLYFAKEMGGVYQKDGIQVY